MKKLPNYPFKLSDELGMMKLVGVENVCLTHAPKTYQFGSDYKAKGVRIDKAEQFIKTGAADYESPFRFREAVAFFDRGNVKRLSVWRKVRKEFITKYDKKRLRNERYYPIKISCAEKFDASSREKTKQHRQNRESYGKSKSSKIGRSEHRVGSVNSSTRSDVFWRIVSEDEVQNLISPSHHQT